MRLGMLTRLTIYAVIVAQTGVGFCGCRAEGSARGPGGGSGAGNAVTAQNGVTLGEVAFRVIRRNVEVSDPADNPTGKVQVLDARKVEFVSAVDTIVPPAVANNLSSTIDDVRVLVQDGSLPGLTDNLASILELVANDPQDPQRVTLNALVKLSTSKSAIDKDQALKLASRMLAYPELENLFKAIAGVIGENDGLDAGGARNTERDLVSELLGLLSRRLQGLTRPTSSAPQPPSRLITALLESVELRGGMQVGDPAWAVRTDVNNNPKVALDPATGRLFAPFVDQNRDNVADVDRDGDPIDAQGGKIELAPFGTSGTRDVDGRLVNATGRTVYDYFDAKKSALGQVVQLAGRLTEKRVPLELLKAVDQTSTRVQRTDSTGTFVGYADDNPMLDLAWALLEIFRYRDAPKLLDSMSSLIKNDPRRAERIMVHLVKVIEIVERSQFQSNPSGHMLDDMTPLLDRVFESNGSGQTAADSFAILILDTFRTEFQRVRMIPRGLAEMMKYTDYPSRTPTGPGQKSCLEQLMDMMAEANQCDSWPFGNMAEFYLDAMAGNKSILGFTISVHTINQLLDIPFLRALLCSQISAGNIRALHAFAQSGALDSLIPIVKAFSDRGQTRLVKNIFLTLGANYPGSMRPNEATLVQVLESGMVEQLFDAIQVMTTMRVPVTNEKVTDVLAQFLAAVVDDDRVVIDRRSARHLTLLHMVLKPLSDMGTRIDQRGVRAIYDAAISNVIDVALETTMHDNGTPQTTADDYEALLYHGIIKLTAAGLEVAASKMSMDPTIRNRDITTYQQDVVSLMTGRDMPLLVDVLLAIERSPSRQRIDDAVVNIFRPNLNARDDIYGSVLEVAAAVLQSKADPQALVDVLRFGGKVLDPAKGWSKPLITGLVKLMIGSRSTTILTIVKNALDRGPAGTGKSPAETLLAILDDVNAQSSSAGGALTAQKIADGAKSAADFIRDRDKGLEAIYGHLGWQRP